MNKMEFRYKLDDKPPLLQLILFGFQWLAVAIPMIIIVGKTVASLHYDNPADQLIYIQKVIFVIGVSILVQIIWGHRLPLVIGPASVLVVGVAASQGNGISTIYTSILISGLLLTLLSISGFFKHIKRLFTPRVIVTILMLIGFTLTPLIIGLIQPQSSAVSPLNNHLFTLIFVILLFVANKNLKGFWKSTLIIWAMIFGTIVYSLVFPGSFTLSSSEAPLISGFFQDFNTSLSFNAGVFISFLVCYLALTINDLGSIQAIGEMLDPPEMPARLSRGITFTGLLNVLAGLFGVVGPVNYSTSPGVISSTGVAARLTLIPTGLSLVILAFLPAATGFIGSIPSVVIGSTFIYVLCSQITAGLMLAFNSMRDFKFENGLVLALPLMLSIITSYLPESTIAAFPSTLKPILGNGFVVGVIAVLIMEHLIFREKKEQI